MNFYECTTLTIVLYDFSRLFSVRPDKRDGARTALISIATNESVSISFSP